jgi:hypothetical protein
MHDLFLSPGWWPQLDLQTQAFIRGAYGVCMLATLVLGLPHAHRYFMSERWGGYAKAGPRVDALQNPFVLPVLYASWLASNGLLVVGHWAVWAALVNLLICRELFIGMRWSSVLRGMGAPGFMAYWVGGAVFLLELTTRYAASARPLALLALQIDFALIFLSAGVYKLRAGYRHNEGVDFGLVNPEWGYWWRHYRRLRPDHPLFVALNQLGWATEIVAAVLMLLPPTRFVGAAIIVVTFALIATQIRLGLLCELVILGAVLFFSPHSAGARVVDALFSWIPSETGPSTSTQWLVTLLTIGLWAYIVLLPFVHLGLSANLYRRRSLPPPFQRGLELYANAFGIIVWRVFSVDVVGFFVQIHHATRGDRSPRKLLSNWGWRNGLRYAQVAEAITVTTLFTTLKYYPSNDALFRDRLLRYARTVPSEPDELLVFEYVGIAKSDEHWEYIPAVEFVVDVPAGGIDEHVLDSRIAPRVPHAHSPTHEAARPGSYAPVRS